MNGFWIREKERSRWQRFFFSLINLIPLNIRIRFLENLGLCAYALDWRHRRIAERNLALAFRDKGKEDRSKILRRVFRNLGRVLAEFTFIPHLNGKNIHRYVAVEGLENFERAYQKGKGILLLGAHFGNWEWMAASFPLLVHHPLQVVVRPLDSPFFDRLVTSLRTWTGNQVLPKQKSMSRILRLLKKKEIIGILLDQNMAWQEGVFVNFFGEMACTNVGLALLALKTGAPVLPVFNLRQKDGRYRVIIDPEVSLVKTDDKILDVEKNTAFFTGIIEDYIRQNPDHWFWLHQRWKTRPWQAKRSKNKPDHGHD